jgi:hypothetical protein
MGLFPAWLFWGYFMIFFFDSGGGRRDVPFRRGMRGFFGKNPVILAGQR